MEKFIKKNKGCLVDMRHGVKRENETAESDENETKRKKREPNLIHLFPNAENLRLEYTILYGSSEANSILQKCEDTIHYNEGKLTEVFVFGKWHKIPRKQVAYGEEGLSYTFSGNRIPARPWPPFVAEIRDKITELTGYTFNFVLVNRYQDGNDHMGEHRDDESDLVHGHPIASLTLGQSRDFIFRHGDSRGKQPKRKIEPKKILLENGSLLMMLHPTNTYWYHSLPPRKKAQGVRVNMTFRLMKREVNRHEDNCSKSTKCSGAEEDCNDRTSTNSEQLTEKSTD